MKDVTHNPPAPAAPLRRRPAWLRALGDLDPPATLTVRGVRYHRAQVYKHDAFACTSRYEPVEPRSVADAEQTAPALSVKFCRTQPAFGVPFAWLGRHLARKERRFYAALHDVPAVPNGVSDLETAGRAYRHVVAHVFVEGKPLQAGDPLDDGFFPALFALVETVHAHGVAVVDLNKIDNVIVDPQGRPHLLDFQLSAMASRRWHRNPVSRAWLRSLQRSDRYHLAKHWRRLQPETFAPTGMDVDALRPASVQLWRTVWRPVILLRRRMFVALGVRKHRGTADTELAPEAVLRPSAATPPNPPDENTAALSKHGPLQTPETQAIPT